MLLPLKSELQTTKKEKTNMPIYVTLLKNTAKGAKEIKDFGKAVEEAAGWITRDGGKILGAYALQGHYDFLWITEYPDTKGIGKSLLSAAARGLVVTETLEALPIDQFVSLLNSPSMTERFGQVKS
jgi:uncharacterized protein with GYD domain